MKEQLTAEELRAVLRYEPETGKFFWRDRPREDFKNNQAFRSWQSRCLGREAGVDDGSGYLRIGLNRSVYLAHRLAWLYVEGKWPKGHIDHINGVRSDNRIGNLRVVSAKLNGRNQGKRSNSTSGVVGVGWCRREFKWRAYIHVGGKNKSIGYFRTMEEAVAARAEANRRFGYHPNHGARPSFASMKLPPERNQASLAGVVAPTKRAEETQGREG